MGSHLQKAEAELKVTEARVWVSTMSVNVIEVVGVGGDHVWLIGYVAGVASGSNSRQINVAEG